HAREKTLHRSRQSRHEPRELSAARKRALLDAEGFAALEQLRRGQGWSARLIRLGERFGKHGVGVRKAEQLEMPGSVAMFGELAPALIKRHEPLPLTKPVSATHVECELAHHA